MTELLQDIDNLELLLDKLDQGDQLQVIKTVQKMIADKSFIGLCFIIT